MKLNELVPIGTAVKELLAKPMKAKTAFKITVATKEVREHMNEFDSQREKLVKEYGTPSETQQGMYTFAVDKGALFTKELEDLLDEEVTIKPFTIKVTDIEDLEVQGETIAVLMPYLVEE